MTPMQGVSRVSFRDQVIKIPLCEESAGTRLFIGVRANDIILSRTEPRV